MGNDDKTKFAAGSGKEVAKGRGRGVNFFLPGWWAEGWVAPLIIQIRRKQKRCRPSHGDHKHPEIGISDGR